MSTTIGTSATRIRGRRSNFIPAPAATPAEYIDTTERDDRVTVISSVVLAAVALVAAGGFAIAIVL